MTRLSRAARAIPAAALGVAVALPALAGAVPALAHGSAPHPVIDEIPRVVRFGAPAVIRAHLEGGGTGDKVTLLRRLPRRAWRPQRTKPVDDRLRVSFRLRPRSTASYRLEATDEASGTTTASYTAVVRVRPRLSVEVSRDDVFYGRTVRIAGHLYPQASGRRIILERRHRGAWWTIARLRAGDGSFTTRVRPSRVGRGPVRARFTGDASNLPAKATHGLRVYDPDLSTWYGPGLYGNRMACGGILRSGTLGVAHRSLRCGTKVSLLYRGRTVTVRVVDRGPYSGAEWDLTEATARRIGFSGRGYVGTIH